MVRKSERMETRHFPSTGGHLVSSKVASIGRQRGGVVRCPCGVVITRGTHKEHLRGKKHEFGMQGVKARGR